LESSYKVNRTGRIELARRSLIRSTRRDLAAEFASEQILGRAPASLEVTGAGGQPLLDPGFQKLLGKLHRALQPFPEARAAVEKAVEEFIPEMKP
jgi:hypothetical protein